MSEACRWGLSWCAFAVTSVATLAVAEQLPAPYCRGEYADELPPPAERAPRVERQDYSFCLRNTATYECLSYGADGAVRRNRRTAVLHGTAFAYRQSSDETLLLTNQHVAEWPSVTDEDHRVTGVPSGCKRVAESLRLVDNEADAYDRDDIALSRVVADASLDAAVVKAKTALPVIPWAIGKSAALKARNVVEVRGFPLGAFFATNMGKVISAFDHDDENEWDHDDFVIDALLSEGNSGSPVLAMSCKTGQFELVGLYHAGYTEGSALNVVVGIDQLRELMTTFKRQKPRQAEAVAFDAAARARLVAAIAHQGEVFFPFGPLVATVASSGQDALVFQVFSRNFPFRQSPLVLFEDGRHNEAEGQWARVWFGGALGLKAHARAELDAEAQGVMAKLTEALRHDAVAFIDYRAIESSASGSREQFRRAGRLERALRRASAARKDLAATLGDLSERFGPRDADTPRSISEALSTPPTQRRLAAEQKKGPSNADGPFRKSL